MKNLTVLLIVSVVCLVFCHKVNDAIVSRTRAADALHTTELVFLALLNAETGQRGFLLTKDGDYLEPFVESEITVEEALADVRKLADPASQVRINKIEKLAHKKMDELHKTILLEQAGKSDEALELVNSGAGLQYMDEIRGQISDLQVDYNRIAYVKISELNRAILILNGSVFVILVLSGVGLFGELIVKLWRLLPQFNSSSSSLSNS